MKNHWLFKVLILMLFIVSVSCEKQPFTEDQLSAAGIKILHSENVKWARDAIPGEGVVLLTYVDNDDKYQFKLIDNAGNEIWTKHFGYKYQISPRTVQALTGPDTIIQIIYDVDNTFTVFRGNSMKKIDHAGNVVFSDNSFLTGMEKASVAKIMLGNADNYLVLGELSISGKRAFVSEFNRQGQQEFIKIYTVNVSGVNFFTDAQALKDGNYLLAGTFESNTEGLSSSFFLANLAPNGDLTIVGNNDITCASCVGRQLYKTAEDNYIYLISALDQDAQELRSSLYHFNQAGEILNVDYADLAPFNLASQRSLLQNEDGSFTGIIKTKDDIQTTLSNSTASDPLRPNTYTVPVYSYYFSLNKFGAVQDKAFFSTSYSNYFNSIIRLSNGRVLIYGALQSFGEEMKLSIVFKES
jgi:hypothetical protein